jgi:hypothetical protein
VVLSLLFLCHRLHPSSADTSSLLFLSPYSLSRTGHRALSSLSPQQLQHPADHLSLLDGPRRPRPQRRHWLLRHD